MESTFKNGTNIIILDAQERIYTQVANYGERKRMLPGGGIERGETPRLAALRETREESGLFVDPNEFKLCAIFTQRPYGLVTLYAIEKFEGVLLEKSDEEILSREFMSFQDIIDRKDEFFLGYIRMIVHYYTWKYILEQRSVIESSLAHRVMVPGRFVKPEDYRQAFYI